MMNKKKAAWPQKTTERTGMAMSRKAEGGLCHARFLLCSAILLVVSTPDGCESSSVRCWSRGVLVAASGSMLQIRY